MLTPRFLFISTTGMGVVWRTGEQLYVNIYISWEGYRRPYGWRKGMFLFGAGGYFLGIMGLPADEIPCGRREDRFIKTDTSEYQKVKLYMSSPSLPSTRLGDHFTVPVSKESLSQSQVSLYTIIGAFSRGKSESRDFVSARGSHSGS